MPKGIGYGLGRPIYPRETKGMNTPNEPKAGLGASNRGMITDGVDLPKGYKNVSPEGNSPRAVPQNKG